MSKWSCYCGYPMNDHPYPDSNAFFVYSTEQWDRIDTHFDDENRISYEDIEDPEYSVYRCPNCGGLMVFGEEDRYSFYQKVDKQEPEVQFVAEYRVRIEKNEKSSLLSLCQVRFGENGKTYTYSCGDLPLKVGDRVLVPVGQDNHEMEATVRRLIKSTTSNLPFPIQKLKTVIGIVED